MRRRTFLATVGTSLLVPAVIPNPAISREPGVGVLNPAQMDPAAVSRGIAGG
jgi:hypothetical protein